MPRFAGVAQLVEHNLAKVRVADSSSVSRSNKAAPIYRGGFNVLQSDPCLHGEGWKTLKLCHEVAALFESISTRIRRAGGVAIPSQTNVRPFQTEKFRELIIVNSAKWRLCLIATPQGSAAPEAWQFRLIFLSGPSP